MNVYALGHGFIHYHSTVKLARTMTAYVKPGTMLDGRGLRNLVDSGNYTVQDDATEITTYERGAVISDHLLCSDITTLKDVNQGAKWLGKQAGFRQVLSHDLGVLFRLDDVTCLYTTNKNVLTRLSDLQDALCWALRFEDFHLHWAACRSFVGGATPDDIVIQCTSSLSQPESMRVMG